MNYLRASLALTGFLTAAIAATYALVSGPAHLALTFGGIAVVSLVAGCLLNLKETADMERMRVVRENEWSRRMRLAQWQDDYFERAESELLPERFDA